MFRIPAVLEKDDPVSLWQYNYYHQLDHQDFASKLSALARALNLPITVTYYSLPPFDPFDENLIQQFFELNWKQHMVFYDMLNLIGRQLIPPMFVFPRNYPGSKWDLNVDKFVQLEHQIHMTIGRALHILLGE